MPELCRFFGIVIQMFYKDHSPPHFHVKYGEFKCKIEIKSGNIIEGKLPRKPLRLVQAWVELHRKELIQNYKESQKDFAQITKIKPLN